MLRSNHWLHKTMVFWVILGHFLYHFILIAVEKLSIFENRKNALENVIQNFGPKFNIIRCFVGYLWLVMCSSSFWIIFWRFYKRLGKWKTKKKSKELSREDKFTTPYQYPPHHNYWMFSGEIIPGDIIFLEFLLL